MPIKIKVFISFLGLVALVLAFGLFNYFTKNLHPITRGPEAFLSLESNSDWDNDGLNNREESYWNTDPNNPDTDGDGYLDGEEVASGHDPLIPSPNDLLPTTTNITDKISELIAAGYYVGDLGENADPNTYNQALVDISLEMLIDGAQALDPSNVSTDEVTFSSDSIEAQEEYVNAIGTIIRFDLWGNLVNEPRVTATKFSNFFNTGDSQSADNSRQYFNSNAAHYQEVVSKINAIPVPPSWLYIHQRITFNLRALVVNHRVLAQTDKDPLKGALAMSNMISVYQDIEPILVNITKKIKENNLTLPNGQLWSLVNALIDDF